MTEIVCRDFRQTECPSDAVLCLVDPPYDLKKTYADRLEARPYHRWVADLLAWSTALRTMIFAPTPTIYDWLPLVPRPDRMLWWHRTFLLPRATKWWAPSLTPILVYERETAPWHGPKRQDRAHHDVIDATSAMGDVGRLRKVFGGPPTPKHPGLTGTAISLKIVAEVTAPGDLVVDPMAGYGSALVAALRLGRRGWGSDIVPGYVEIARKWLDYERLLAHD